MPGPSTHPAEVRDIYPLNRLSPAGLQRLLPGIRTAEAAPGEYLFRIGDSSERHFYLLSGRIDLIDAKSRLFMSISQHHHAEPAPLPQVLPSLHHARVAAPSRLLTIERGLLDTVLSADQPGSPQAVELAYAGGDATDWQRAFKRAAGYASIGRDRIERLFRLMQPVEVRRGDCFIREGQPADDFFVIAQGRCEVLRTLQDLTEQVKVTEYGPGASIGEDGLISASPRNATVRMVTDGRLMRLAGAAFREILMPALALSAVYEEARALAGRGSRWLDVRLPREVDGRRLPNALYIPHPVVRARLFTADPKFSYIVVCSSLRDSPVIAYMLAKYGYDARYLEGGFAAIPPEALI